MKENMTQHAAEIESGERFAFGKNWVAFLAQLDEAWIAAAENSLRQMLEVNDLQGKTFLDIGSGSPLPKQRPPVLAGASLVIGVVCALRPEKGLPTLLEAFAKVVSGCASARLSGLRLVVVGSGAMLQTLQEMSNRFGLQDRCHFEPSTADVARWLRANRYFCSAVVIRSALQCADGRDGVQVRGGGFAGWRESGAGLGWNHRATVRGWQCFGISQPAGAFYF